MTKDQALQLALDALHGFIPYLPLDSNKSQCDKYDQAITAIKEALETEEGLLDRKSYLLGLLDQKPWVGLTDEEIFEIHKQVDSMQYLTFGKAIEAKLKEKNDV